MVNKEFKTWLILDYKTGKFRVIKKRPENMKTSELPIKVKIKCQNTRKTNNQGKGGIDS